MDLAFELRISIYYYALVVNEPFDFNPATELDLMAAMRIYRENLQPRVRVLRVSKQVHTEAAPIYYGQEFRFASSRGWIWLLHFIRTIGPQNTALLRKISVHLPFDECVSQCKPYSDQSLRTLEHQLTVLTGFNAFKHSHEERFPNHQAIVKICQILERVGKLEDLNLILRGRANIYNAGMQPQHELLYQKIISDQIPSTPEPYPISNAYVIWALLQRVLDRNEKLKTIKVIRLRAQTVSGCTEGSTEELLYRPFLDEAERRGWCVEVMQSDKQGQ